MYPSPRQAALLIALQLKRAQKTRARVSEKTVKLICGRTMLREAFLYDLRRWLEDFGVLLVHLERGGFALVAISALEGAPPILAKGHIEKELKALKAGSLGEQAVLVELGLADDSEEESD
jgi:hypothetical protein